MSSRITRSLLSCGAALTLCATGVGVAVAESESAVAACTIRVDVPNEANNATVGRAGCSNTIPGTGRIKEDRSFRPDDVILSRTFDAGLSFLNASCGNGEGSYYSEFSSSSGAFAQSSRNTSGCS